MASEYAVGNLTSLNDGTGTTTYGYNKVNLMTTLTDPGNAVSTYGYDNNNRKTSIVYPNGAGMLFGYDTAGRITSLMAGKMSNKQVTTAYLNYTYNYGPSGKSTNLLQSETELNPLDTTAFSWTYGYDAQNQLKSAVKKIVSNGTIGQQWSMRYDANGNLLERDYTGGTDFTALYVAYNAANEPTTATGSTTSGGNYSATDSYSYDGNGNLTAITTSAVNRNAPGLSHAQTHVYNSANQDVSGTGTSNGVTTNYVSTYSGTDQTDRVNNSGTKTVYTTLGLSTEKSSKAPPSMYAVAAACSTVSAHPMARPTTTSSTRTAPSRA